MRFFRDAHYGALQRILYMKFFTGILFSSFLISVTTLGSAFAQSLTGSDSTTKELELRQKELELERAKVEQQKAQADVEQQRLALEKARRDLQVQETNDQLQMALSGDVLFDTNQATIKPDARETLSKVATVLSAFPNSRITITGYADARGSSDVNLKLSRDRAEAVKTWLLAQLNISSDRIFTEGAGEANPVAPNETSGGRQLNRRVEITVTKGASSP